MAQNRTAGVFDPVRDNRMDWLWAFDDRRQLAYVKEEVLDKIESAFYDYLEEQGWPAPVSDWVLTMGIQGGAASFQWNDNSDVDVMVVLDWLKLFEEMGKWDLARFQRVDLADQYAFLQRPGGRLSGRNVKRKLEQCISGRGVWQGKGIRNRPVLQRLAPTHPIDYSLQRGLHRGDLRFDDQPPIVQASNLSSYLVDLPVERRRREEGRGKTDTVWMNEIEAPPTGFSLERDAPELYQKGLVQLRYVTMPFDFLYEPDGPRDIVKGMEVLGARFSKFMKDRTEGYRAWASNPGIYTVEVGGKTYGHPDWFPNNVGVKLLEVTGPKDGKKLIKEILRQRKWKDRRYVQRNFRQVAAEIRDMIGPNYVAIRRPFRFKNPRVAKTAARDTSFYDTRKPTWWRGLEDELEKKFRRYPVYIYSTEGGTGYYNRIYFVRVGRKDLISFRNDNNIVTVYPDGDKRRRGRELEIPERYDTSSGQARKAMAFLERHMSEELVEHIRGLRSAPDKESVTTLSNAFSKVFRDVKGLLPGLQDTELDGTYVMNRNAEDESTLTAVVEGDRIDILKVEMSWTDRVYRITVLGVTDQARTPRGFASLVDRYIGRMTRKGLKQFDPMVKDMILGKIGPADVVRGVESVEVEYEYVDNKYFLSTLHINVKKRTQKTVPEDLLKKWVEDNWREVESKIPRDDPPLYGDLMDGGPYDRHDPGYATYQTLRDTPMLDVRGRRQNDFQYDGVRQTNGSRIAVVRYRLEQGYRVEYARGYDDW